MKTEQHLGYILVLRTSNAFWDSLNARTDAELEDMLDWAKRMNSTNCGWMEFSLKDAIIRCVSSILDSRFEITTPQKKDNT